MNTVTINVTARDISRGVPKCIHGCPVARAAKRVLGRALTVDGTYIKLANRKRFTLPTTAKIFIGRFDHNGPESVIPFKFKLPRGNR